VTRPLELAVLAVLGVAIVVAGAAYYWIALTWVISVLVFEALRARQQRGREPVVGDRGAGGEQDE
jgi:hypothetical protein